MIRHNLRRVRMLPLDGSLHCSEHGLLDGEERADVLDRVGRSPAVIMDRQVRLGALARLLDRIAAALPARCETVR